MVSEHDKLDDFYANLKAGTTVMQFLDELKGIVSHVHCGRLTENARTASGRVKKLFDEVIPVARFARKHAAPEDRISFALDDSPADCWVQHADSHPREVQVTVIQARERFHLMKELNEKGISPAFLGLADDVPTEQFKDKICQPKAYTEEDVGNALASAVRICAEKKSGHSGNVLLIEAPFLEVLRTDRWENFRESLAKEVEELAFDEVYVTGRGADGDICLRIKGQA